MFLIVTGVVIGCDSDDGPTVTAPSGGGSGTPTRDMPAEQSGSRPPIVGHPDQIATSCVQQGTVTERSSLRGDPTVRNSCGIPIVAQVICGEEDRMEARSHSLRDVRSAYETLENARRYDALVASDPTNHEEIGRVRRVPYREGLAAYAVDDYKLLPGSEQPVCGSSEMIERVEACYLREQGDGTFPWFAYAPTFETRDINARWNCLIRELQTIAVR